MRWWCWFAGKLGRVEVCSAKHNRWVGAPNGRFANCDRRKSRISSSQVFALVSQQSVDRVNFWKINHEFYLDCTADIDLVFGVKGDRSGYNHRTVWYVLWGARSFPFNSTYTIRQDTGTGEQLWGKLELLEVSGIWLGNNETDLAYWNR